MDVLQGPTVGVLLGVVGRGQLPQPLLHVAYLSVQVQGLSPVDLRALVGNGLWWYAIAAAARWGRIYFSLILFNFYIDICVSVYIFIYMYFYPSTHLSL